MNHDDVRGLPLANAMKNMDIGDIRPREVVETEDDKDQVLTSPIVQASVSQTQDQHMVSLSQSND